MQVWPQVSVGRWMTPLGAISLGALTPFSFKKPEESHSLNPTAALQAVGAQ